MIYLSSSLPSLMTNLSSHPHFVPDSPQHWFFTSRGNIGILGVLVRRSFPVPAKSCPYFPKDILLVVSEVRTPDIVLGPSVYILGFSSSHIYNLCFDPTSPF